MINKEDLEKFIQEGYPKLRKYKKYINNIDKDFFFDFADYLLSENQKLKAIIAGKTIQELGTSNLYGGTNENI